MNQGRGGHESGASASLTAAATGLGAAASRELLIASLAGGQDEPASPELISATLFAASTLFPGAQAAGSSTAAQQAAVDAATGDGSASCTSASSAATTGSACGAVAVPVVDSDFGSSAAGSSGEQVRSSSPF